MDSPSKSKRCNLLSIITNSTSRRKSRTAKTPTFTYTMSPIHQSNLGHHGLKELIPPSSSTSSSSPRISSKLTKLRKLKIPDKPILPSVPVQQHPTVLRAGPQPNPHAPRMTPRVDDKQQLFIESKLSIVPDSTPVPPPLLPTRPTTTPHSQDLLPSTSKPVPATATPRTDYRHYTTTTAIPTSKNLNKPPFSVPSTNPIPSLSSLAHAITTLYDHTSILIPPYLFERLNHLHLIDDNLDYDFPVYKNNTEVKFKFGVSNPVSVSLSREIQIESQTELEMKLAIEKIERVQQFLGVLRRVVDLCSEEVVKEREKGG